MILYGWMMLVVVVVFFFFSWLYYVAEDSSSEEGSDLTSNPFEPSLQEPDRVTSKRGKVGVVEGRVGPRAAVEEEVEEDDAERPDVCTFRLVGRMQVVATFCVM